MLSRFKLRTQYALLVSALVVLVTLMLSSAFLLEFRRFSENSNQLSVDTIVQTSYDRAVAQSVALIDQLANNLSNPLYFLEFEPMGELIGVALAHPDIESVIVIDKNLRLVHKGGRFRKEFGRNIEFNLNNYESYNSATFLKKTSDLLQLIHPVRLGDDPIGWVLVDFSLEAIQQEIDEQTSANQKHFQKEFSRFVITAFSLALLFLLAGIALAFQLSARLENPIIQLARYTKQIGQGNFDAEISLASARELEDLSGSLNKMAGDLNRYTQEIEFLAFHDSLTNLPNRRYLLDKLDQLIKVSEANNQTFSLLFVDIDNFKAINDRYGHDAGDHILTSVVTRIKECIHSSESTAQDIPLEYKEPVLARLAGDEFVVLLPGMRSSLNAAVVSEQILESLAEPHIWKTSNILLSVSIGIAGFPENGKSAETLLKNADSAMYHVKENSKNNYYFFSNDLNAKAQQQRQLLDELNKAVRQDEFELWFQPQINISTGNMLGAEALIRWRHPKKGIVPPDAFIPVIEDTELMQTIGLWVIEQALLFLRSCRTICPGISISVNLSASQLKAEHNLIPKLADMLVDTELAENVHLEITETYLLSDEKQAVETLKSLHNLGFQVWLDDFGTGYSALSHLKSYSVDGVKIDKSFVQGIESQWENRSLTQAILSVAEAFEIQVIAEGVETEAQKGMLQGMGCKAAQGFLFAHPMPQNELLDFLTSNLLQQD